MDHSSLAVRIAHGTHGGVRGSAAPRAGFVHGAVRGMDAAPGAPMDGFAASPCMNPARNAAEPLSPVPPAISLDFEE